MFFVISGQFVAICGRNDDKLWTKLCLFDLKSGNKREILIDLTESEAKEEKSCPKSDYRVICGQLSPNCDYLSVYDNRKQLFVFKFIDNNWKQVFKTKVNRNCIKLLFSLTKNAVICGHKSGDVYEYEFDSTGGDIAEGRLLLGHCSMLLDLIQSPDKKYLISSDRDEKIRISLYPNSYNIQSYCLGHKEFVSSVDTIDEKTIISGSGDGSIRLWSVSDGKQLDVFMADPKETIDENRKTGTKFAVKKLVTNLKSKANLLSVCFYKQSIIQIYSIDSLSVKLIHSLDTDVEPIDMMFDVLERDVLWLLLPKAENPLTIYKISAESVTKDNIYENVVKELNSSEDFVNSCLNDSTSEELNGLYKHWFNNVETYLQKKMERKEEMNKKKKFCRY